MATLVKQLQTKAVQASQVINKYGTAYYKQLLEQNKQYIASEPTVEKCQELSKQLFYTRLASFPGRYKALWEEVDYVKKKLLKRDDLKLEEVIGVMPKWFPPEGKVKLELTMPRATATAVLRCPQT